MGKLQRKGVLKKNSLGCEAPASLPQRERETDPDADLCKKVVYERG